ncbi:hypothetical protein [Arsenicibacter rosenii]|uniref:DUF4304 domain-containing protein n=1 Tax=Arsenicibacter rosenii TaxID=1750698 RepID=A0A1S2VPN3_9BACT|nr:hypothetical protein [Arsenicibacter rosenii]OIN60712.1 hypothetical protein BLX24_00960 [Arsenicibacter rosenii]
MPTMNSPFETNLFRHLSQFFADHHYLLLADQKQFRKITATGFQNVIFSPSFYQNEILVDILFGTRNQQVEQIAQQFLRNTPEYRDHANTTIISIGKFRDMPYFRYKLNPGESPEMLCADVESFFLKQGFSFLDQTRSVQAIDTLLNSQPDQPCKFLYNQTHRCYKGLIAAHLNHSPQFDGLIDRYRFELKRQTQNAHEQLRFERLIAYLLHYSAN